MIKCIFKDAEDEGPLLYALDQILYVDGREE
jgi:hypothetical protein